ncbi:MAG: hypothetical protein ACRENW_07910 [Thermodesulfobacteriota bacterium]
MRRSGGKTTTGKSRMIVQRRLGKTRPRIQTTSLTKTPKVSGTLGRHFRYEPLPFVKKLSKKSAMAARVLEDSYKKGVAIAAAGDLRGLLRSLPLANPRLERTVKGRSYSGAKG